MTCSRKHSPQANTPLIHEMVLLALARSHARSQLRLARIMPWGNLAARIKQRCHTSSPISEALAQDLPRWAWPRWFSAPLQIYITQEASQFQVTAYLPFCFWIHAAT